MSDSFGSMVGRALLGDEAERAKQMVRVECKAYAMHKMFCECGTVFDQRKIQILRDESGKVKAVCCQACRTKAEQKFDGQALPGWTWVNWKDTTGSPAIPEASELAKREAKRIADSKPKPLKAMTQTQVLAEVSAKLRSKYKDVLRSSGLLCCGVMVVDTTGEGGGNSGDGTVERAKCFLRSPVVGSCKPGNLLPVEPGLEHLTYRQMIAEGGEVACVINEVYRLTCEKLGNVVSWKYSQGSLVPCVVGCDDSGRVRASLAVIQKQGE